METSLSIFFKNVRAYRQFLGQTQEMVAEKAGVSYKYYQKIEAGTPTDVRLSTLDGIANAFGVKPSRLLDPNCFDEIATREKNTYRPIHQQIQAAAEDPPPTPPAAPKKRKR